MKKSEVVLKSFREIAKNMKLKDKLEILEEQMLEYSKKEEFDVAALLKKEKESVLSNNTIFKKVYYKIKFFIKKIFGK